jgi:hypothetical protein
VLALLIWPGAAKAEQFTFTTPVGTVNLAPELGDTGDGTNNGALFVTPVGICLNASDSVFVLDGHALRQVTASGANFVVTTLAGTIGINGTADGTNAAAGFNKPQNLTLDASGNLYVADSLNHSIRKITPYGANWAVTTIAGTTGPSHLGNADGTNGSAQFNRPSGIARDAAGNLYVADTLNHTIRKITPVGTDWVVTTIAGQATVFGTADGTNSSARFHSPFGLTIQNGTNVLVADFNNQSIRLVRPSGTNWIVSTIAGLTGTSGSSDGTNSDARFYQPKAIGLGALGSVYVTDSGNNTIRKILPIGPNWVTSTVAGQAGTGTGSADGTGPTVRFNSPFGIGMSSAGRLWVTDSLNKTVRLGNLAALLDLTLSGPQVRVAWPLGASNFVLETSGKVSGSSWLRISNGVAVVGDNNVFTTNSSPGSGFFRLHKP